MGFMREQLPTKLNQCTQGIHERPRSSSLERPRDASFRSSFYSLLRLLTVVSLSVEPLIEFGMSADGPHMYHNEKRCIHTVEQVQSGPGLVHRG